jgi:hypothetical protein
MFLVENPGPPLAERHVAKLEANLGFPLAASYRQFLLDKNGGTPVPDCIDVPGFGETDVQVFFGIGRSVEASCISWNLDTLRARLPNRLVPIACDSGGNVFCLSAREEDAETILYLDLESVYGNLEAQTPTYAVAPAFESFIASLRPV